MTNHKQERAQRIVDATMELTLRPQQGDRAKVIAAAIRAIVNELHYDNGVWLPHDNMIVGVKSLLKLADEVEALEELTQENPQVPLDAL